ncbi:histidine kinase [Enterococcus malodoratus]|uniref:histidine kinase n=1 Tax=Enterococcus malodoratus TaxID=71451 RepID=UPI002072EC38|nr:histidine kinase [Enterococcus malodoratus]
MNKTENPLRKLVDQRLYGRYGSVIPISNISLILVDNLGEILMEFNPEPEFCKLVCKKEEGSVCNYCLGRLKNDLEHRYVCEYGLENIYMPIVVGKETLGYVIGVQAYSTETEYKKYLLDVANLSQETGASKEKIAKALSMLGTVDEKEIRIYEQICGHVSSNIALDVEERVLNNHTDVERLSIEKEILEKKILDLETKNDSLVINPHFLFNTLNSIARTAYFENSHTTEELIYCLSDILRYTLKSENQLHTIEAELDYINKYLYIQKVRFKDRLNFEINISEGLLPQHILNMTLQPIVENALIHGITPKRDGGTLRIYSDNECEDVVIIYVEDDGNGFPQRVLTAVRENGNIDQTNSLGFKSTDRRLKQYFGEDYGLFIKKSDYSGSIVGIKFPRN